MVSVKIWSSGRTLLRHQPFRHQFLASTTSMIGSALTPVALAFGVIEATGSISDLGYVLAAYSVTQVVFILAGGVWADRVARHRLMMLADGMRVFTQTAFGVLLLTDHASLWTMLALQAICGAATALYLPASSGLVATTAPPGLMQEANAFIGLTRNLVGTVGPIAAGAIVVASGAGWALILDGMTFILSMFFLSRLALPPVQRNHAYEGFWLELAEGWREVARRSWVWTSVIYFMVFNLMFASFQVLGPAALSSSEHAGLQWGAILAGLSVGQVIGNSLAVWFRPKRILLIGRFITFLAAPSLFLLGSPTPLVLLIAAGVLAGIALSFPDILWDTALQLNIPSGALSRVLSFDYIGSMLLRPVGLGLAAVVASELGTTVTLTASAVVLLGAGALSLLDRPTRTLAHDSTPAP